jgi:hypothetical protein
MGRVPSSVIGPREVPPSFEAYLVITDFKEKAKSVRGRNGLRSIPF